MLSERWRIMEGEGEGEKEEKDTTNLFAVDIPEYERGSTVGELQCQVSAQALPCPRHQTHIRAEVWSLAPREARKEGTQHPPHRVDQNLENVTQRFRHRHARHASPAFLVGNYLFVPWMREQRRYNVLQIRQREKFGGAVQRVGPLLHLRKLTRMCVCISPTPSNCSSTPLKIYGIVCAQFKFMAGEKECVLRSYTRNSPNLSFSRVDPRQKINVCSSSFFLLYMKYLNSIGWTACFFKFCRNTPTPLRMGHYFNQIAPGTP